MKAAVVHHFSEPLTLEDVPVPAVARRATLADGAVVTLRDVGPDDEALLRQILEHVTGDSRALRFFSAAASIDAAARLGVQVDGVHHIGLIASTADGRETLGHGMCIDAGDGEAEIAFEVVDGHHRRGIGGVLLEALVQRARATGYRALVAEVLPENRDMLDMLDASGLPRESRLRDGVRHVTIDLGPSA
jgi:acetyltransferase